MGSGGRKGLSEEATFEVDRITSRRKAFRAEGTVSARALRPNAGMF